jgi:hypothetical protein
MASKEGCVAHALFSPKDIERLEARAAALSETNEFPGGPNDAYIEAATRIANEAKGHKETILSALKKEDDAKAAEAKKAEAPAPKAVSKFENVPDLVDAVAKEAGMPQVMADAYTQHTVLERSLDQVAKDFGVGKSTVGDWVKALRPLVDAASLTRLERGAKPAAPEVKTDDDAPGTEAATEGEHVEPTERATESDADTTTAAAPAADEADGVSETTDPDKADRNDGNLTIQTGAYSKIETKASNDGQAEATYKKVAKDGAQARWDALNSGVPEKKRVAWDSLGPGQQAAFAAEVKKGKAAEAHESISTMRRGDKANPPIRLAPPQVKPSQRAGLRLDQRIIEEVKQLFPAISRATDNVGWGTNLMALTPGRSMAVEVAAAVKSLSEKATFFANALHSVSRLYVFKIPFFASKDAVHPATLGFFAPASRELAMNSKPMLPYDVENTLAHELGHAADAAALDGTMHEGSGIHYASDLESAVTRVHLTVDHNGDVKPVGNKIAKAAIDAYKALKQRYHEGSITEAEQELLDSIWYALEPLAQYAAHIETHDPIFRSVVHTDPENRAWRDRAEYHFSNELLAILVQSEHGVPGELAQWMPAGSAFAKSLLAAQSNTEVFNVITGRSNVSANGRDAADAGGASAPGPAQGVPSQVRAAAAPGDARISRSVQPPRAQGDQGRQPQRAAASQGSHPGLNIPPPVTGGAGLTAWLKALTSEKAWRNFPSLLGWLSTEQMADRWKDIPLVKSFSDTMRKMEGRAMQIMAESDKHSTKWSDLRKRHGAKVDEAFGQFLLDATTATIWPDRPLTAEGNKHLDAKDAEVQAEHARLARTFRTLPAAYQSLFKEVVADKAAQRAATVAGLRSGIVEAYYPEPGQPGLSQEQIDAAAALPSADRAAFVRANAKSAVDDKTLKSLWSDLDQHKATFPTLPGPYFPKMRFGDHVVSYKSATYQAAERAVEQANAVVQQLLEAETYQPITDQEALIRAKQGVLKRTTRPEHRAPVLADIAAARAQRDMLMEPITAARKVLAEQQAKLVRLKDDGTHYGVEFYENRALALANEDRLRAHFGNKGTTVTRDMKARYLRSLDGVTPQFVRTLEEKMSASLSGVDAAKVRDAVRELYLRMQPENSALKRQLKRANVSGVRADEAHRAYAHSSMQAAHAISRLEHGNKLHEHLNDLRFNHKDEDATLVGNELAERIAQNMAAPDPSKLVTAVANGTYLSYLGLSPSFVVTQATQPWVITAPIMAGKHGVRTTGKELAQGTVDAAKLLKGSYDQDQRWKYHLDPQVGVQEGYITPDEAKMLQEMIDHGRIDITITHDLGATSSGADDGPIAKAAAMAAWPAQQMEMANRVATALAGYRAERSKGTPHIEAMAYADGLVADTHLNYAASNRARHMHATSFGGWGRVMFQFRAYQQGMLYLIYKNMVDGARGDPNARRSLAYLAGMQLATAGLAGMPVPGVMAVAIGLLYQAFTEDDDERDLKEMLFQGVASVVGDTGATAVMKGIPAALGVDVSAKVGMGNIAEAVPYADERAQGRAAVKDYFAQLVGGPALGMVGNWAEAAKSAGEGKFLKATAQAAPTALAGPLKAYGYATEGMLDSRGNTILGADEMSAASAVIKALGFQPTEVSRVQDQRRAFFEARGNRDDARSKLLADYAQARSSGGDLSGIREDVTAFNKRNPENRITISHLEKAVAARKVRDRNMRHGIPVGKKDRALAEELGID